MDGQTQQQTRPVAPTRFVGIDVGADTHVVAVVDAAGGVELKPRAFGEDAAGYQALWTALGEDAEGVLVGLEATGHYWQNLVAHLLSRGVAVVVLNPLQTRRFAEGDLSRTKTDAQDALGIARLLQQKRPVVRPVPDALSLELKEAVGLRERLMEDWGAKKNALHRLLDLGFPEFTRHVKDVGSELATSLLARWPTAEAFGAVRLKAVSNLAYDGRRRVGQPLAAALLEAARTSVGAHHGAPYRLGVKYACEDLCTLRARLRDVERDISGLLERHDVARLLLSIDGLGDTSVARLLAACGGDPARFDSPGALAAYVGCVPALRHSGKRTPQRAGLSPLGNARLRSALWMPTLVAVRHNPWLRAHYERLRKAGKLPKVALIACMRKLLHAIYSVAKHRRPFTYSLPAPLPEAT